jgi:regulator of RNase E activity RraA
MPLSLTDLLKLQRWNTPTIYNGWEQITDADVTRDGINIEPSHDFMPQMGPMIGYAVTLRVEPSNQNHQRRAAAWQEYRAYVASVPGPKIAVVQDLDQPRTVGSFWGEVNANVHRALGCVGTITDGAIRDLDEMTAAGFKAIARRLCVGHAHVIPVDWDIDVQVFGQTVRPSQLIHADKHGFLAIPAEDEDALLDAALFMDNNECNSVIAAGKSAAGLEMREVLDAINEASQRFGKAARERFDRGGEW